MRGSVDRNLVVHLLKDPMLSYREIARRAECSDFSVRSIARDLADEYSTDDSNADTQSAPLTPSEWTIFLSTVALIFGAIFYAAWRNPPMDGGAMQ